MRLHDVLICLSKFSDTVAIEAEHDLVRLLEFDNLGTLAEEIFAAPLECAQLDEDCLRLFCLRKGIVLRGLLV